jgi:hypothetical protein
MSELRLHIDDQYMQTFLSFLQTLSYVKVEEVVSAPKKAKTKKKNAPINATDAYLTTLPPDSPLRKAIKPIRQSVTAEELIRESGYVRTDWAKIREIGQAMDIPQSTEELLSQLTA